MATVTRVNARSVRVTIDGEAVMRVGYSSAPDWPEPEPSPWGRDANFPIAWPGTPENRIDPIGSVATATEIAEAKEAERQRLERKADRFAGFAESAYRSADSAYRRSGQLVEDIPLGQPILVGHHSEARHRRTLQRSRDLMGKSIAESDRGDTWANRVASIEREMRRKGLT